MKKDEEIQEIYADKIMLDENISEKSDESTYTTKGKIKFKNVNHQIRASKFGRMSDGEIKGYLNIALEYFGYRCALSGEKFESFGRTKVQNSPANSNLSAEHIVPLCQGGDDIVPNLVPSVLQYNISKNGYNLLDWWESQKDIEGNSIYSPYRLLKIVNYVLKSEEVRRKSEKEFREKILTPNDIDKFLKEKEKEDVNEGKRNIISEVITALEKIDGKNFLKKIPNIEGNILKLNIQPEVEMNVDMMDIFVYDSIEKLKSEKEIPKYLVDKLSEMFEKVKGTIPFELRIRDEILKKIKEIGIEESLYSIANKILLSSNIIEKAKKNEEELGEILDAFITQRIDEIKEAIAKEINLSDDKIIQLVPEILFDFEIVKRLKNTKAQLIKIKEGMGSEIYDKYLSDLNDEELLKKFNKGRFGSALEILKWVNERDYTAPPQNHGKDTDEDEKSNAENLYKIRRNIIPPYQELVDDDERKAYIAEHPEIRFIEAMYEKIVKVQLIKIKEELIEIKEKMGSEIYDKYLPAPNDEELLKTFYKGSFSSTFEMLNKGSFVNALEILKWVNGGNYTAPPQKHVRQGKDKDKDERSNAENLSKIRRNIIKPYQELVDDDEKKAYIEEHPEIRFIEAMYEKIAQQNTKEQLIKIKEELIKIKEKMGSEIYDKYLPAPNDEELLKMFYKGSFRSTFEMLNKVDFRHALEILEWVNKRNYTAPPQQHISQGKDKDKDERSKAQNLSDIRCNIITPYQELVDDDERKAYIEEHPEIRFIEAMYEKIVKVVQLIKIKEELIEIKEKMGSEIYDKYLPAPNDEELLKIFYKGSFISTFEMFNKGDIGRTLEILKWVNERNYTAPPQGQGKNAKNLSDIKFKIITPYQELVDDDERKAYIEEHPEIRFIEAMYEKIVKVQLIKIKEELIEIKEKMGSEIYDKYLPAPNDEELLKMFYKGSFRSTFEMLNKADFEHALEILKWVNKYNYTAPPQDHGKDTDEDEIRNARNLSRIRCNIITPYQELVDDDERKAYIEEHPEIRFIEAMYEKIDQQKMLLSSKEETVKITKETCKKIIKDVKTEGILEDVALVSGAFDKVQNEIKYTHSPTRESIDRI